MADLRIYKRFYVINNNSYTLINPQLVNVEVYNSNTSVLVESPSVIQESVGVYYLNINPNLYNSSDLYEIRWIVNYTPSSGVKNLSLFFMYDKSSIIYYNTYKFGEITYELTNNKYNIEITNNTPLIVEIKNNNDV